MRRFHPICFFGTRNSRCAPQRRFANSAAETGERLAVHWMPPGGGFVCGHSRYIRGAAAVRIRTTAALIDSGRFGGAANSLPTVSASSDAASAICGSVGSAAANSGRIALPSAAELSIAPASLAAPSAVPLESAVRLEASSASETDESDSGGIGPVGSDGPEVTLSAMSAGG